MGDPFADSEIVEAACNCISLGAGLLGFGSVAAVGDDGIDTDHAHAGAAGNPIESVCLGIAGWARG